MSGRVVKRKGHDQRLNNRQRMEIITVLEQSKPSTNQSIARQYGVDEKIIRKLKASKDEICERIQRIDHATQEYTFRVSYSSFPELEKPLYKWIDVGR